MKLVIILTLLCLNFYLIFSTFSTYQYSYSIRNHIILNSDKKVNFYKTMGGFK